MDAGIDMVLIKPVESSVVETLLMLECERINGWHVEKPLHPFSGPETNRSAGAELTHGL
jgi:hypothetical protein